MTQKQKFALLAIAAFFATLLFWVMFVIFTAPSSKSLPRGEIACTMEAKLCPDGSAVGRTGPYCEFAPCPPFSGDSDTGEAPPRDGVIIPTPITEGEVEPVFCTMDARECPDGSFVSRTGPNCAFAPCPSGVPPPPDNSGSCKTNADCAAGYSCIDASPVVREGYQNLRCWKDGTPTPICLSGLTRIATPQGERMVKYLKEGDVVWSINTQGQKIAVPVGIASHTNAPKNHRIVHLVLSDARELFVSPGHKVADGRTAGEITTGDMLSGATLVSTAQELYGEKYTYDILPLSETGMYWGNSILLQSTLR